MTDACVVQAESFCGGGDEENDDDHHVIVIGESGEELKKLAMIVAKIKC